ncbi:unnamed protein product [Schistocephalus solidus]|uniref:Uncharacterized protein n=1 Tax=Schistocephalus solidus TaxID=70667 RepID=A0A3P7FAY0_SCHSO|nr:unnamed protein product [Schistocephalus solidus]
MLDDGLKLWTLYEDQYHAANALHKHFFALLGRSVSSAASGYPSDQKAVPPEFEDPAPSVIYLPLGADLDLRCSLTSQSMREPVRFIWSFNFKPLPDDPSE